MLLSKYNNTCQLHNLSWSVLFIVVTVVSEFWRLHFLTRSWISPWIKLIFYELDIAIHVITSQLLCHCDVFSDRLWRHQQNENWVSEPRERCVKIVDLSSFMDSFCCVRNKIMYVLTRRTVSALTRVLFWCLFPSLLRNSGNKHQNNPLVSAEIVRHSRTYIILHQPSLVITRPSINQYCIQHDIENYKIWDRA